MVNPYREIAAHNPIPEQVQPDVYDQGVYGVIKSPMQAYAFEKSYNQVRDGNSGEITDPIQLKDKRRVDAATGKPLADNNRFGYKISKQTAKELIKSAKEKGLDPGLVLSMALQETGVQRLNPLHDNAQELDNYDVMKSYAERFPNGITAKNVNDSSIENLANKLQYAKSHGKLTEAEQAQAWNGYGTVENMYGLPGKTNMSKNPVYGKRIVDLKNNVIKNNPEILTLMKEQGMAEGGIVKGPGTGKSDSVPSQVNQGDFIVPAENAQIALAIGAEYLGWDDNQESETEGGNISKQLSNGEVRFTAEEVQQLSQQGIDISILAPNAEESDEMANGGLVWDEVTGEFIPDPNYQANPEDMPSQFVGSPAQPQAQAAPQPEQPKIKSMFDLIKAQEPIEDKGLQERARKAAIMSAVGQVFGNLAGAVAPRESRIPRLQQDQNIQKLYGIVDREQTKHEMLKRDWNQRMGAAQWQDQQMELSNKRLDQQQKKIDADAKRADDWKIRDWNYKIDKDKYDMLTDDEKFRYQKEQDKIKNGIARDRLNKLTAADEKIVDAMRWRNPVTGKEENPYNPANPAISKAERDALFDEAVKNASPEDVNAIMQNYQLAPESGKNQIIVNYLNKNAVEADRKLKSANLDISKLDITGHTRKSNVAPPSSERAKPTAKPTSQSPTAQPQQKTTSNVSKYMKYAR